MLDLKLASYIARQQDNTLLREKKIFSYNCLNFSNNDYLSLANDPQLKQSFQEGINENVLGSGGSMVVSGYHSAHKKLEKAFAKALNVDECLLFSSGYAANLSILNFLNKLDVHVFIDKNIHASIYDGLKLSGISFTRYLHNNAHDLAKKISAVQADKVIMTEGVFSMSGEIAPLSELAHVSQSNGSHLIVDEAHAFGILGPRGTGAVTAANLTQDHIPLRIIPLGKSAVFGGAVVAGKSLWINSLLQCARPYIYSTAMSPLLAHGLTDILSIILNGNERRRKLSDLINYFRHKIKQSNYTWRDSTTPIQQLQLGCPKKALTLEKKLQKKNIMCISMREPTVTRQETGLRVILNYAHNPDNIDYFFDCIE